MMMGGNPTPFKRITQFTGRGFITAARTQINFLPGKIGKGVKLWRCRSTHNNLFEPGNSGHGEINQFFPFFGDRHAGIGEVGIAITQKRYYLTAIDGDENNPYPVRFKISIAC